MTDQYAVIGHPIAHSKSPLIHARFARQTQQDMRYDALLAPLDGFASSVQMFIAAGGRGLNVTVPFKEEACQLASRLSARAQAAGAVNTLSFQQNEILGDNTDGAGLVRDIRGNLNRPIQGKRLLLLGAGGAARGCLLPLWQEQPAALTVANRTPGKAIALARSFQAQANIQGCGFSDLAGQSFDLIINATSAGLSASALDIPATVFAHGSLAYDMLYGRETPFMSQARAAGAQVSDGLGMLIEQAAEAFWLWRGVRPLTAALLQELRSS